MVRLHLPKASPYAPTCARKRAIQDTLYRLSDITIRAQVQFGFTRQEAQGLGRLTHGRLPVEWPVGSQAVGEQQIREFIREAIENDD